MNPAYIISYALAITYIATIVYIMFIWNRDDRK